MDNLDLLKLLERELSARQRELCVQEAYYEGEQTLKYLHGMLKRELGENVAQLVLNWPEMVVDAYDERSDVEGFRYKDAAAGDESLWDLWQANEGDTTSQQVHIESLIHGVSYVAVGSPASAGDPPVMTAEHPKQVGVRRDPKSRKVTSAIKRWRDDEAEPDARERATLYLPDETIQYVRTAREWEVLDTDPHGFGVVAIVPFVNRGRMLKQDGRSEFQSIRPVADAANKIATDMMTSAEYHAMPRRWAIGIDDSDFTDPNGQPLKAWETVAGQLWASDKKPDEVQFGQFHESDLSNFHSTIKLLATLAAQLAYLPMDYLSFVSDNPSSADAIRAQEARHVKRCERKHVGWGASWERVMRLMLRLDSSEVVDEVAAKRMETLWRDPSTPTVAQVADAVTKKYVAKLIPKEQARIDLGYTPEQRRLMREMDDQEGQGDPLAALAAQFRTPPAPPAPEPTPTPAPAADGNPVGN